MSVIPLPRQLCIMNDSSAAVGQRLAGGSGAAFAPPRRSSPPTGFRSLSNYYDRRTSGREFKVEHLNVRRYALMPITKYI